MGCNFHIAIIRLFDRPTRPLYSFHALFLHKFWLHQLKSAHCLLFYLFSIAFISQKRPNYQFFRRYNISHTFIFDPHESLLVGFIGSIVYRVKKLELTSELLPLPVTLLKYLSVIGLSYSALVDKRCHFSRLHVCPLNNSFFTFG